MKAVEITSHPMFKTKVKEKVAQIIRERHDRENSLPGHAKLKRSWYDTLSEAGNLNAQYFIDQAPLVWAKLSTLSSLHRQVVQIVCQEALEATVAKMVEEAATDKAKTNG